MNPKAWLLLDKAREDLAAAEDTLKTPRPWRAASDAYYAMFHAAEALLLSSGVETSSHAATQAAFGQRFAKTGRLDPKLHRSLLNAFDKRITEDYDVTVRLSVGDVEQLVAQARDFVSAAEQYLENLSQ